MKFFKGSSWGRVGWEGGGRSINTLADTDAKDTIFFTCSLSCIFLPPTSSGLTSWKIANNTEDPDGSYGVRNFLQQPKLPSGTS